MSDYRAIAGVSGTLRTLLRDRMEMPPGLSGSLLPISIGTPTAPPEQTSTTLVAEDARLNLFLFQIQENAQLKNRDLPGVGNTMAYGKPPLCLNLSVMLTAYGSEVEGENTLNESLAQFLLGSAMRVLHDYPVITAQMQTVSEPYGQLILHESLRDALEPIRLTLEPITLEDLTKVWTALTIPYRLSVAYRVAVVQVESRATRRYPRLVGEPPLGGTGIVAVPLDRPYIDTLTVRRAGDPSGVEHTVAYARVGDVLILHGQNFHHVIQVEINGLAMAVEPLTATRIEVTIPDATIDGVTVPSAARLQPGAQPVEVLAAIEGLGSFRLRSNRVVFMLVPLITAVTTVAPRTVTIHGQRLYLADSSMQTLIGNALFTDDAYISADPAQITLNLPDVLPCRSVACLVGAPVTDLSTLDPTPELRVTIGGEGPHTLAFTSAPATLAGVVVELENALRSAPTDVFAFRGARVTLLDNRLVIVPGGMEGAIVVELVGGNAAAVLGLLATANRVAAISGVIAPFPTLTSPTPAVQVQMDGHNFDAVLASIPHSIEEAAVLLQAAIRGGPSAAFTNTEVTALDDQLLILTGGDAPIAFAGVSGGDQTTVAELHLHRSYALRVRVSGAESLGNVTTLELPL